MLCKSLEVIVKSGADPATVAALREEAALLRFAAHPGVVEVVRSGAGEEGGWELVLRKVSGTDLAGLRPCTCDELAGFGVAVATTLADLHDLGVVHRALTLEHLLVDEAGRPVLCGFGRAGTPLGQEEKAADVADLARCLTARLPAGAPRALRRTLAQASAPVRYRPVTARSLALMLGAATSAPTLPVPATLRPASTVASAVVSAEPDAPAGGSRSRSSGEGTAAGRLAVARSWIGRLRGGRLRGRRSAAVAGVLAASVMAAIGILGYGGSPPTGSHARPHSHLRPGPVAARCPGVDRGCVPLAARGGVFTLPRGRYRIGTPGDVLVLGRWTCTPSARVALLQPATGRVWAFSGWASAGRRTTASFLRKITGARSLRVLAGADGCDRLEVLKASGPPVVLTWRLPASARVPGAGAR